MTHITKFKPRAYYLAANFFVTFLDVKLNFCLNHRTPSHLTSMEGTREKTQCLELSICSLYLDGRISLEQCNLQSMVRDTSIAEQELVEFLALPHACRTG